MFCEIVSETNENTSNIRMTMRCIGPLFLSTAETRDLSMYLQAILLCGTINGWEGVVVIPNRYCE